MIDEAVAEVERLRKENQRLLTELEPRVAALEWVIRKTAPDLLVIATASVPPTVEVPDAPR